MSQPEGFHLEQPEPTGSFATVCSSLRSTISYLLTPKKRFANEEQGEQRTIWGHSFTWTPEHSAPNEIHHLLYSYDKLATDALDRLDILSPPTSTNWKCHGKGSRDLYALLEQHHASDEVLGELWNQVITVPEWVDWDQLKRGQQVLYQFSGQMLLGLFFKSLLAGMGAYRVVETLSRTGGFGIHVTRRRLLETFQHFLDITASLPAIQPGGSGFVSCVRVRLLHAAVRQRLMALERERPGYFDVKEWGVPINDLHCIGTVSAYSTALVYIALPRQGVCLSEQQAADYIALWRWVGYILGTPVSWMATPSSAKAMMESVILSEYRPSDNSRILANNILTAEARVPPLRAPREYLAAQAYRLNGEELMEALGIAKPGLYYTFLSWMQCFVLMGLSYSYPWLSDARRKRRDEGFIRRSQQIIDHQRNGEERTTFQPQYEPCGKMTELTPIESALVNVEAESFGIGRITAVLVGLLLSSMAVFSLIRLGHPSAFMA